MDTGNQRQKRIYRVTLIGSAVNLALVALKFAAGILGRSAAMVADAVHSLSDLVTDAIVLVLVRISGKPSDHDHQYGHGKFEALATLLVGLILLLVGVGIAWNAVERILTVVRGEVLERPGMVALIAAAVSVLSKEILYRYTVREGRAVRSDAVIANAWHHRSDAFSSVGTMIGIGGAVLLGDKWVILDPVAALAVSYFIIRTAVMLMKPSLDELMEKSLPDEVLEHILEIVRAQEGVFDPHNLRTRKIGERIAIEMHIRMAPQTPLGEAHKKVCELESKLRERYGPSAHITIHMEPEK